MKKAFIAIAVLFITNAVQSVLACPKPRHVKIEFDLARPKFNCTRGIWFCNTTIQADIPIPTGTQPVEEGMRAYGDASYEPITGDLTITFDTRLSSKVMQNGYFFAEGGEEVVMPPSVNEALGAQIKIMPGRYKIDFTNSTFGTVIVKTAATR